MKKLSLAIVFSAVVGAVAGSLSGCTPADTAADVTAAVTTAQVLCVLNNATLKSTDIASVCGIATALLPAIEQIVGTHEAAAKREALAK